jgi:hypothetical protein
VRYYSFFCWVFWTFWQHKPNKATLSQQRKWRIRLENVLRSATLYRDSQFAGLVGVTKTKRINDLAPSAEIAVAGGDAASAFVPAAYSASFRALGCGLRDDEKGARLTKLGENLAEAFDLTLRSGPGARSALATVLSDTPQVKVGTIRVLADGIRLRPINLSEPEHKLLKELLLRSAAGPERLNSEFDQRRSLSFALLMEIVQQAGMRNIFRLEPRTTIPQNSYIRSYRHILGYFAALSDLSASDLVRGAHMVYGWMPTTLDLMPRNPQITLEVGAGLLTRAKTEMLTDAQITDLRGLINNSVIGASKLLHFVAPDRYAIWDSKVCSFVLGRAATHHCVNNVGRYRNYLNKLDTLKTDVRFREFHRSVINKVGYQVSDLRAIELVMFCNT